MAVGLNWDQAGRGERFLLFGHVYDNLRRIILSSMSVMCNFFCDIVPFSVTSTIPLSIAPY